MLRNIYRPKSKTITEKCGKLHSDGLLHELCSFPSIGRTTISRRMIFAGLMAFMEDRMIT